MARREKLYFRVDASPDIGVGHFTRCLALAEQWCEEGGQATFVGSFPEALRRRIESRRMGYVPLHSIHPDPRDIEAISGRIPRDAVVVLDGYKFDGAYQRRLRESSKCLLIIDDSGHLPEYHGDILLNQNVGAEQVVYQKNPGRKLLGPGYALLRREFLRWAEWKREIPPAIGHLMVTLGGGDPDNHTLRLVEVLTDSAFDGVRVRMVAGPANPHQDSLRRFAEVQGDRFELLTDVTRMPELMAESDLALSAAGTTCWELAFMGLPSLLVSVAENQEPLALGLASEGAAVDLGPIGQLKEEELGRCLKQLMSNPKGRSRMSECGRRLIDGGGAARTTAALKEQAALPRSEV